MSLFIFHTKLKPRERGTQFPLISASLEGFSNALTSQRRQKQQMTDLKDSCPNVSATEPPSYIPVLLMWLWRAGLPNFLTLDERIENWQRLGCFVLFKKKHLF